ncbi:6415_t:CDS:1, partial [Racocetra fulgida]
DLIIIYIDTYKTFIIVYVNTHKTLIIIYAKIIINIEKSKLSIANSEVPKRILIYKKETDKKLVTEIEAITIYKTRNLERKKVLKKDDIKKNARERR